MKENSRKPSIRFLGFTEAWEQCKLEQLGVFTSNGVDKLSKENEIPVNLLNYMDVYNRLKITTNNCTELMQVTARPEQIKNNNVLAGDIYFTPTSETAEDIGHVLVIEENLPNTVYSYHLIRYRPKYNVFYLTYPNYGFDTVYLRKQMTLKAKGAQRFVISKPDFEKLEVLYPSYAEQEKIAKLLGNLDSLITLHQQNSFQALNYLIKDVCKNNFLFSVLVAKLYKRKKVTLEKVFLHNNEIDFKITLKAFIESWEQCKIGDIFKVTRGFVLPINKTSEIKTYKNPYPVYSSQTKDNGLLGFYSDYLFDKAIT